MNDWRTMEQGSELDKLISRRLRSWKEPPDNADERDKKRAESAIAHYSTSIDHALGLILYNLDFRLEKPSGEQPHWIAYFRDPEATDNQMFEGHAKHAALAVCRARMAYEDAQGGES